MIILRIRISDSCTPDVFRPIRPSDILLIGRWLQLPTNLRLIERFVAFLLLIPVGGDLEDCLLDDLSNKVCARLRLVVVMHHLYNII